MGYQALTTPVGLPGTTFNGNLVPATYPALTPPVIPPPGNFSVSIAGHNYNVDTSLDFYRRTAFKHTSIPAQRDSLNFDNSSGENVVNTAGLWRRSGQNWALGAGQKFYDAKQSNPDRYFTSKGINPWVSHQLSLLQDTVNGGNASGSLGYTPTSGVTSVQVMTAGTYTYYMEPGKLSFRNGTGAPTTITNPSGIGSGTATYLSMCHNGGYVYLACGTGGIYYVALGSSSTPTRYVKPSLAPTITNATWSSATATYTTSVAHGFVVGDYVTITGMSPSGYNITNAPITTVPSSTTFTVAITPNPGSFSSGGTVTPINYCQGFGLVAWLNDRLFATAGTSTANYSGPYLCAFQSNHIAGYSISTNDLVTPGIAVGTTPATVAASGIGNATGSNPTGALGPTWVWSALCQGSSQIYAAGYNLINGQKSDGAIYRTTNDTQSPTTPSGMTYPIRALPMAAGEYPTGLYSYLNYIFVGTNLGVRMCQTLNAYDPNANGAGDLKAGPIVPGINQSVSQPVTNFVGYKQYVWFTWSNYDTTSTGIGRMDLTNFIDDLAPAYASDLMVTGQGTVDLDWDYTQNAPLIAVSGDSFAGGVTGVYQQSANLVASGTFTSGQISYDIPENKTALYLRITAPNMAGSIQAVITPDNGNAVYLGQFTAGGANDSVDPSDPMQIPSAQNFSGLTGKQFNVTLTLQSTNNKSPVLSRWQLDALPQVASETNIMVVLSPYPDSLVEGADTWYDPYAEYYYLDGYRRNATIVWYVEGNLSARVIIESLEWCPERQRADYQKGYLGLIVATLKTINGFTYQQPSLK